LDWFLLSLLLLLVSLRLKAVASSGTSSSKAYTGVYQSMVKIYTEEGLLAFWKGNFTNVVRIFPYSACQLMANDAYKRLLSEGKEELSVSTRLLAGALAGMTASAVTHPLDTVRLRLAMPKHPYSGLGNALATVTAQEGVKALYKGLGPTLIGIAPYAALNFATYDLAKLYVYGGPGDAQNPVVNLLLGAATGSFAASCCYPLDTVRRRMQMKGEMYSGQLDALKTIWRREGYRGFYRGWAANTLKVVPQNSIRFVSYELMKKFLGISRKSTDT
jgi:solute carrier family 25 phosphate transporter 23/24/25/41